MQCQACGFDNVAGAIFCSACGVKQTPREAAPREFQPPAAPAAFTSSSATNPAWAPAPARAPHFDPASMHPFSIGEMFDAAFSIYRANFMKLTAIFAAVIVPVIIFNAGTNAAWHFFRSEPLYEDFYNYASGDSFRFLSSLVVCALILFASAASVKISADSIFGIETGASEAALFAMKNAVPLFITSLLFAVSVCIAAIGFFVPSLIIFIMYIFWPQAVIIENRGGFNAMRRSSFLITNFWWKTFLTLLFGAVFALGLSVFPPVAASMFKAFMDESVFKTLNSCMELAGMIFSLPVCSVLMTVLYYDIRVRKEGLDIECSCDALWP